LAGYDHESDNGRMAAREARLRAQLKLPASLIDRAHSHDGRTAKPAIAQAKARKPASRRRRSRP